MLIRDNDWDRIPALVVCCGGPSGKTWGEHLGFARFKRDSSDEAAHGVSVKAIIIDDESDEYCAMGIEAWPEYMKTVNGTEVMPEMGKELEREDKLWGRHGAALKAGVLRYYRIEGIKTS